MRPYAKRRNTSRSPTKDDFSVEAGCLLAITQDILACESTADLCRPMLVSVRPEQKVVIVKAEISVELLQGVEARRGLVDAVDIYVSNAYDINVSEERVVFLAMNLKQLREVVAEMEFKVDEYLRFDKYISFIGVRIV